MDVAGQRSSLAITFWRRLSSMAFSSSVCRLPNPISVNLAEQGTGPRKRGTASRYAWSPRPLPPWRSVETGNRNRIGHLGGHLRPMYSSERSVSVSTEWDLYGKPLLLFSFPWGSALRSR